MILCVCLNLALDRTYEVDGLEPYSSHRVRTVHARAGGKGVNVAAVLHQLGQEAMVTGLAGGPNGAAVRTGLGQLGLADGLVEIAGNSRQTLAVTSRGSEATVFNEPGPVVSPAEWRRFIRSYDELVADAALVVLSGSLPPGLSEDAYAVLLARTPVPAILDTSGAPFRAALSLGPELVKPNEHELLEATDLTDPLAGVAELRRRGAGAVVASFGPDGLMASDAGGAWRARLAEPVVGNATGAGDACVAALAAGMVTGSEWPERLRQAVALSAAAVLSPVAGQVDLLDVAHLADLVSVEDIAKDLSCR